MTEADILHWIRDTSLGVAVRQSRWMFATGETLHFLGLSLLVGGILIVDLRILGFLRNISMRSALSFLPFVIIGFVINMLTGILNGRKESAERIEIFRRKPRMRRSTKRMPPTN